MEATKRRGRFQVHLSTALALMVAAGGVIWANTRCVLGEQFDAKAAKKLTSGNALIWNAAYGWPWTVIGRFERRDRVTTEFVEGLEPFYTSVWHGMMDAGVALAILTGVWYISERRIRRREMQD